MLASIQIVCLALFSHLFLIPHILVSQKFVQNAKKGNIEYELEHKLIALQLHVFVTGNSQH